MTQGEGGRGTNNFDAASLIFSTFVSLRPLILDKFRFVVAWTAYGSSDPS